MRVCIRRAEYPIAVIRLLIAIQPGYDYGLLGDHIFETDFSFKLHIRIGAVLLCAVRKQH
jgi:NADH:ubiquinone oxidoreductase subunit F (NADH-binding)